MNHHTYNFRSKAVVPKKGPRENYARTIQTKAEFQSQRLIKTPVYGADVPEDNLFYGRKMMKLSDKYYNLSTHEVNHTFDYIFNNLKKGTFIQIYKNTIETFAPFNNLNFKQPHPDKIQVDPSKYKDIYDLFTQSSTLLGLRPITVAPPETWYMNNSFIRYDDMSHSLNFPIYYDMFLTLQNTRDLPDLEFFLNKRDNPILSAGPFEPYFHLVGSRTYPLKGARADPNLKYTPILSTSKTDDFADVLIPTHDDWCRAVYQETGFTIACQNKPYPKVKLIPWGKKIPQVVFRGTTTGAGTTPETNQRLRMWQLVQDLPVTQRNLFNVGFVKWNIRPRKHESGPYFDIIKRSSYPRVPFMTTQEQSTYKYILNVEGHVAAFRLGYEMSYGSVILLVDSEWKLWYSHMIHPWIHYVPVKADMSDLVEMVMWCEANQDRCQMIAQNALNFYNKYLGTKGILDYLQHTLCHLNKVVGLYVYGGDWLPGQLRLEYDLLLSELQKKEWLWHQRPVSKIGVINRNYNVLEGVRLALQGSYPLYMADNRLTSGDLKLTQRQIGSVTVEELQPLQEAIVPELIHAAYVGRTLNNLVQVIPNFRFMFGILNPNHKFFVSEKYRPYKAASGPVVNQPHPVPKVTFKKFTPSQEVSVYQESLPSDETLLDWLNSRTFASGTSDMVDLLGILVQVNLALQVAQNKCGFMHCNLVPKMIRLVSLQEKGYYKYPVKDNLVLSLKTSTLAIISGYRNARVIVCDKDDYLTDHNYPDEPSQSFKSSKVIDSLTLLITCLQTISNRVPAKDLLMMFNPYLYRYNIKLTEYHLLYKNRFDLRKKNFLWMSNLHDTPQDTPMTFVNFILTQAFGRGIKLGKADLELTSQPGNPIAYCFMLLERDRVHALRRCINYLARQTFPKPTDPYLQQYVKKLQDLHLKWLSGQVSEGPLAQQFTLYKRYLDEFPDTQPHQQRIGVDLAKGQDWVLDLPYNEQTLQNLRKVAKVPGDHITTLEVISKMLLLGINTDYLTTLRVNSPFDFLSSIGKLNSLIWLATN